MSGRLRLWMPASLFLLAPATGLADHCLKPCPSSTPPTRIVVEMSPPEVTVKAAAPVTAAAPTTPAAAPGHCPKCGAPKKPAAAPAPAPAPAPGPAYGPAPFYQLAPYALVPVGPAYGPPPCGSAPPPGNPGAALPSADDLKSLADLIEAHERTALQQHMAYLEKQYAATATKAAAAGLRPAPLSAPKAISPMIPPAAPSASAPMTTEQILQEIENLKVELLRFKRLVAQHDLILEQKGLIAPPEKR